jgi:urease accessory protein
MKRLICLLLAIATPVHAHGALPGGGGFYAGAAHPFVSLDHLVALLAIGLMLSQHDLRAGLGVLIAGVAIGLALPFAGVTFAAGAVPLLAMGMVAGATLALARSLPVWAALVVSLISGLCIGLQTDVPMDTAVVAATAGAGVIVAVFLIAAYALAIGTVTKGRLQGLPLRVAGSWLLAIALMMLAFLLRDLQRVAT